MQLVINTYGSYLQKSGENFRVKTEEKQFEISSKKVSSILISTSSYMSTDAVKLAMENNIDIVFLNEFGDPYGRVWHSKLGSTVLIRRRQLEISEKSEGLHYALTWIKVKLANQIDYLKRLRNKRPKKSAEITSYIEKIESAIVSLGKCSGTLDDCRGKIMGIEGNAGRIYFEALGYLIPEKFSFKMRSRNPAKDEFNCMLNYAYGVLYSKVEKACIIAGLDPYVGFLHTDNYNKKSMVFDLIENYRIWAEEKVFGLFSSRKIKEDQFDKIPNGFTLNKEGKRVLISAFNEFLDESVRYRGRNIKRCNIIQFDCHKFGNELIKNHEPANGKQKKDL